MPCEPRIHSDDSRVFFGRWSRWLPLVLATVVGLTLTGCGGDWVNPQKNRPKNHAQRQRSRQEPHHFRLLPVIHNGT